MLLQIKKILFPITAALLVALSCSSEPQNPYPQGYPQGYQQAYPQQTIPGTAQGTLPAQANQVAGTPVQQQAPVQTGSPVQGQQANPFAGLAGALGQAMGQPAQTGTGTQVQMIPWQSLSQALPTSAPGWSLVGQVEGESANMLGIAVSTARCKLQQGAMEAKVEIVDTTMNPLIAMPFTMMRAVQVDSSEERRGPVNFGVYPGTQAWKKQSNEAEVLSMVHNRVMVTVTVTNAGSELPASQLASLVNYAHLASLIGG